MEIETLLCQVLITLAGICASIAVDVSQDSAEGKKAI